MPTIVPRTEHFVAKAVLISLLPIQYSFPYVGDALQHSCTYYVCMGSCFLGNIHVINDSFICFLQLLMPETKPAKPFSRTSVSQAVLTEHVKKVAAVQGFWNRGQTLIVVHQIAQILKQL